MALIAPMCRDAETKAKIRNQKWKEYKDIRSFYCSYCGFKLDSKGHCRNCKQEYEIREYDPDRPLYMCPNCQSNILKVGTYCPLCGGELD
jgi:predicted amidophosphoribosyltransferase